MLSRNQNATMGELRDAVELRSYGIKEVRGDRYAGLWPRERFLVHGIEYIPSEKPKSDLYRDILPALNSGRVRLIDLPRLVTQLCTLERRTARGGKDSIDHPTGGHDDVANAVAGVVALIIGTGASDGIPFAQTGSYTRRMYSSSNGGDRADWVDRLSPQQALERGFISPKLAQKLGIISNA